MRHHLSSTAGVTLLLLTACEGAVLAPSVATVTIHPDAVELQVGDTLRLNALARDAAGRPIEGRVFTWTSSDERVATVDASGLLTARARGAVTLSARSEDRSGTSRVSVRSAPAARVSVTPGLPVVGVGERIQLRLVALSERGDTLPQAAARWISADPAVAVVDDAGALTGVAEGRARVVAHLDGHADTVVVAVLGPSGLLSTALAEGQPRLEAAPGARLRVPITLDLSRAAPGGDLGSLLLDVTYDPRVLEHESTAAGARGMTATHLVRPGRLRLAFAGVEKQSDLRVTLATLTLRVAAGAAPGARGDLHLLYVGAPTRADFGALPVPVAVAGRVRVVSR